MRPPSERVTWAATGLVAAAALALAWYQRLMLDDAFISLRFAEHAVAGHGLVYNPGERVEGYTNFLWTVLLMARPLLGVDPERFLYGLGMVTFAGALALVARVGYGITGRPAGALGATLMAGLHLTTNQFATTGMETTLQGALVLAAWWTGWRALQSPRPSLGRLAGVSVWVALAGLTRMDSALLLAPLGAWLLWGLLQRARQTPGGWRAAAAALLALGAPVGALMGAWLLWKVSYYGDVLPNTYYAKTQVDDIALRGLYYVMLYMGGSVLLPVLLGVAGLWALERRHGARPEGRLVALMAALVVWMSYVIKVGGDFMDLRFMVPLAYLLTIPTTWALNKAPRPALALALGGLVHAVAGFVFYATSDPSWGIANLNQPILIKTDRVADWIATGKAMRQHYSPADGLRLSATTAGALPYYSEQYTLDMHGLSEPWVARHGDAFIPVPGHYKIAPADYLLKQGVHLNFQIPITWRPGDGELCAQVREGFYDLHKLKGAGASIVHMPLGDGRVVLVMYLKRHEAVEAKLRGPDAWRRDPLDPCIPPPQTPQGG